MGLFGKTEEKVPIARVHLVGGGRVDIKMRNDNGKPLKQAIAYVAEGVKDGNTFYPYHSIVKVEII